ncbi:MAG TPA: NUDIX domain-containing protein [Candidatus Omnitrophota bacterium]|nr:NUDIX domain-containing protein [Candidatus Omnitrophota bacterium]
MNHKILAFIYDGKKFLILRNNSADSSHGGDFWFTVTGSLEKGETEEDAVKREVKEETGLDIKKIFNLNWGSIYSWDGEKNSEDNFLVFAYSGKVVLNEEHIEYEWLSLKDFVKKIKWYENREELEKVLRNGIKKRLFFNDKEIKIFKEK